MIKRLFRNLIKKIDYFMEYGYYDYFWVFFLFVVIIAFILYKLFPEDLFRSLGTYKVL